MIWPLTLIIPIFYDSEKSVINDPILNVSYNLYKANRAIWMTMMDVPVAYWTSVVKLVTTSSTQAGRLLLLCVSQIR